jgi:hypothetical protein
MFLDCASSACASCQSLLGSSAQPCCTASAPNLCFVSVYSILATATTDPVSQSEFLGCSSAFSVFNGCESETSGFTSLDLTAQAACLCYSSSTWIPDKYDSWWNDCAAFETTDATNTVPWVTDICSSAGNVLSKSVVATTTSTSVVSTIIVPTTSTSTPTASISATTKGGAAKLSYSVSLSRVF